MGLIVNSVIPDALCTLKTCSLLQAHFQYLPSLPGNALYLSIFAIYLVAQVGLGIRYRTWGFMGGMVGGLILEVLGYLARVQMHNVSRVHRPHIGGSNSVYMKKFQLY